MPAADRAAYRELQAPARPACPAAAAAPACRRSGRWRSTRGRSWRSSYILTSGEPDRPEKDHEVQPGWPFAPRPIDFRDGRVEAFADWLTAPDNPLFARVAVNRLWQWHFGEGLQKTPSDFGELGGTPANPRLLDWLASEFVRRGFSMKAMHRLIVTSDDLQALDGESTPRGSSPGGGGRPRQRGALALPPASTRGRADLGFDPRRGRRPRPLGRRPVVRPSAPRVVAAAGTAAAGPSPIRASTAAPPT